MPLIDAIPWHPSGRIQRGSGRLRWAVTRDQSPVTSGRGVFPLGVNHTLQFGFETAEASERERRGGNRELSELGELGVGRGWGDLGSIVLFAVGFIAQNAVDLVDDGRRQFWKDLYCSNILHKLFCIGSTQEHGADALVPQAPGYGQLWEGAA